MFEMTALGQSWMYQSLPAALVLAGLVTGCAGMGDQSLDDALADPGKHAFYTCGDLGQPQPDGTLDALRIRIDLRKRGTNHVAKKGKTLEHQTFEFEKNSQSAARSRMGLPHA